MTIAGKLPFPLFQRKLHIFRGKHLLLIHGYFCTFLFQMREYDPNSRITVKIQVIKCGKVSQFNASHLVHDSGPTSLPTVTTVHNWQIALRLHLIQIGSKGKIDILIVHFRHQATKLPHPYLNLNRQKRAHLTLAVYRSRMRYERI